MTARALLLWLLDFHLRKRGWGGTMVHALGLGLCFWFFFGEGSLLGPQVVMTSLSLALVLKWPPEEGVFFPVLVLPSANSGDWILTAFCHFFFQQDGKHFSTSLLPFSFSCKVTTWQSVQLNLVSLAAHHKDWRKKCFPAPPPITPTLSSCPELLHKCSP